MNEKTAKELTKALQENSRVLTEHAKVLRALLKASGQKAPQQSQREPGVARVFNSLYGA